MKIYPASFSQVIFEQFLSVMYPWHEVLITMLLAVVCGATSYARVEMFGISKKDWLGTFFELEYGIFDACTFRKVIREIDTEKLHTLFGGCMKSVVATLTGVLAIDSKQACGTVDVKRVVLFTRLFFKY